MGKLDVKISESLEVEAAQKALDLAKSGSDSVLLNEAKFGKNLFVFIDNEPTNCLLSFAGIGELEGKVIYVGNNGTA